MRAGLRRWWRGVVWLVPLLIVAGLVHGVGLSAAPQYTDAEGALATQVYDVDRLGELPGLSLDDGPLGPLQLAAFTSVTGAFDSADHAVAAVRWAMLLATLVSAVLVWALARRLELSRVAAATAVALFAVSPLAVHVHRTADVDNVALPWILAAFVLSRARRRQPPAFAVAGVVAGVAVLTSTPFVLLVPFVVGSMWQAAVTRARRVVLAAAGGVLVVLAFAYLLVGLADAASPGPGRLELWWEFDPVLLVLTPIAAIAALALPALRPIAAAVLMLFAVLVVPGGDVWATAVVAMIPLTAVVLAAVAAELLERFAGRGGRYAIALFGAACAVLVVMTVLAAVLWAGELRSLLRDDRNATIVDAHSWLATNVDPAGRLIVGRALVVELVEAGFDRHNVVPFGAFPTSSPEEPANARLGWLHYDYLVSTASLRSVAGSRPDLDTALEESSVVAVFGTGDQRAEIREIHPLGREAAAAAAKEAQRDATYAARQLLRNDALRFDPMAKATVEDGLVDPRIVVVLGQLSGTYDLSVQLPAIHGEDVGPRRRVVLSGLESDDTAARLGLWLQGQPEPFAPSDVDVRGSTVTATFSIDPPPGLLPGPPERSE